MPTVRGAVTSPSSKCCSPKSCGLCLQGDVVLVSAKFKDGWFKGIRLRGYKVFKIVIIVICNQFFKIVISSSTRPFIYSSIQLFTHSPMHPAYVYQLYWSFSFNFFIRLVIFLKILWKKNQQMPGKLL